MAILDPQYQPSERRPEISQQDYDYYFQREKQAAEALAASSGVEAAGGLAAVALSIIALAGVIPGYLAPITAIVAGAVLFGQQGTVAAMLPRLFGGLWSPTRRQPVLEMGAGIEVLAGAAALVLGILSLIGINSMLFVSIAALVLGAGLVLGDNEKARFDASDPALRALHRSSYVGGASGATLGLAALVLGILAITGVGSMMTLSLVSFLCIGTAMIASGATRTVGFSELSREEQEPVQHQH